MHNLHYLEGLHSKWERERERERESEREFQDHELRAENPMQFQKSILNEKEREMHYNLFDAFTLFRGTAF